MKELLRIFEFSSKIPDSDITYSRDKKLISEVFELGKRLTKDEVIFRLTIIDSYYTTQMSMRYFIIYSSIVSSELK